MDERKFFSEDEDFKFKSNVPVVEKFTPKPGVIAFASPTPQKIMEMPLHSCTSNEFDEGHLQERYITLLQLFDRMTCSLRLLALRKKPPTFHNVCTQVELLSQRKFSYQHLAQMKYLLPEAIQIDKILIHDKKTQCMKPDMKIVLLFDVVEGHHELSDCTALHQVFASRLDSYFTMHPEACDIPEGTLPGPFNQSKHTVFQDKAGNVPEAVFPEPFSQESWTIAPEQLLTGMSIEDLPRSIESELLEKSSHLHPSFSRHFSQKFFNSGQGNAKLLVSPLRAVPQAKESPSTCSKSIIIDPLPDQSIIPEVAVDVSASASPPCESASSANGLLETPAQAIPKRAMPSCEDTDTALSNRKKTSSYMPAKRALDFSKDDKCVSECYELHDNDPQTLDGSFVLQKENLDCPFEDHKMNQSEILPQHVPVCLSDLVSLIHHIFQSVNYSPITKEELVYKIIISSLDFIERGEIEEQIGILEKLVPEWLIRKLAPSGDILYNIKKMPELESVLAKVISI